MQYEQDIIDMDLVTAAKSDQFNAVDLSTEPQAFTIESVKVKPTEEQPVEIRMVGHKKLYRPCKTMSRVLKYIWGRDGKLYAGKSLTLFCDPEVRFGPDKTGGIRIYSMEGVEKPVSVPVNLSRKKVGGYIVRPLKVERPQVSPPPAQEPAALTPKEAAEMIKQSGNAAELRAVFGEVYKHFPAYDDATRDALTDLKDAVKLELTEAV